MPLAEWRREELQPILDAGWPVRVEPYGPEFAVVVAGPAPRRNADPGGVFCWLMRAEAIAGGFGEGGMTSEARTGQGAEAMTGQEALEGIVRMLEAVEEADIEFPVCQSLAAAIIDHRDHLVRKTPHEGTYA
ncbi:MAG: hypothetical protein ACYC5Q_02180 [Thermoleophilia bacterium]